MRDLDFLIPRLSNAVRFDRYNRKVGAATVSKSGVADKNSSELNKACQELESLFMGHLLKEMRATVTRSGFLSGGRAEELYTSMLDGQLARELSARGGIGIAALLADDFESKTVK